MSLHLNLAPDLFIAILVFDKPVLFRVEEAWELLSRTVLTASGCELAVRPYFNGYLD